MASTTATNAPAPHNPELVIRKLDEAVTIFSVPFKRMGLVPFGGRSTAIKLKSGNVWLAASHPLCPDTLSTITSLGPVKHIVMFDAEHGMFTESYHKAFPEAKLYFPPSATKKWKSKGLLSETSTNVFTYGEGKGDPFEVDTKGEIKSAHFTKAHVNEDIAFYHAPTKTMIEADLLMNLPPHEQYSKTSQRSSIPFLDHVTPGSGVQQKMLWYLISKNKQEMSRAAKEVAGWDFDRVIPCHGDVIEPNGKKAWLDTYAHFLSM
ncbi:uncharacterized protein JCM6883_001443 [Sporobolomyces salmoneus]|uniref:uncharacterized protein n=1 Tax=Sporobolomyces salmoneus TaxID=183962 RepID=UPI00317A68E7